MATMTIELHQTPETRVSASTSYLEDRLDESATSSWDAATAAPSDSDAIFQASLAADAAVPDGGAAAWLAITACAVITFWFVGTSYSWGVMQDALVEEDKLASASTLAFVGSLAVACNAAFAIINSRLLQKIGTRNTAIVGISAMSIGQIVSGFLLKSVAGLFITAGLMMGYGISCCFMAVSVLPAQYFNKKRGLANGIVFAGGGLGGAVISLTMSSILKALGTAWTFRLIGILMLVTGLPAAWIIKDRNPIRKHVFVEWKLFKDMRFLVLFLVGVIVTFPLLVPPFFLPLYARSLGFGASTGAALVAAYNFASAVGRVICGLLGDKIGAVNSLFGTVALFALSMLILWPVSTSLAPLIVFCVVSGIGNGGFFAIIPTVVGNVFGSARMSVAMGMIVTGWTSGYLMGAPIAGYMLDAYGGQEGGLQAFRPAIFYAGSMAMASAGLVAFIRLRMSKSPLRKV